MHSDPTSPAALAAARPAPLAGGLPPGLAGALLARVVRPLRWVAGGSLATAIGFAAAMSWLPVAEGEAEALAASPRQALAVTAPPIAPPRVAEALVPAPEAPVAPRPAPAVAAEGRAPERTLRGVASYYAAKFEGRPTASGERYRGTAFTAAHRTLPFGTRVRVTNPRNGRSVVVRINDRGPFHPRRVIDVSRTAAIELGILRRGRDTVELEILARR